MGNQPLIVGEIMHGALEAIGSISQSHALHPHEA